MEMDLYTKLSAKHTPNWSIQEHMDSGPSLMLVHRTHIPIITNEFVTFYVGNESKNVRR